MCVHNPSEDTLYGLTLHVVLCFVLGLQLPAFLARRRAGTSTTALVGPWRKTDSVERERTMSMVPSKSGKIAQDALPFRPYVAKKAFAPSPLRKNGYWSTDSGRNDWVWVYREPAWSWTTDGKNYRVWLRDVEVHRPRGAPNRRRMHRREEKNDEDFEEAIAVCAAFRPVSFFC
ncbi:hypothetical protein FN846DRAFT_895558 [Sphaerosporella brunnea]|uniref:Uncharacterized protein n=1 Tax=Sphaerosporella brunnea TaxID=1250544 RepID=A0A5J5EE44_9PEZI|nr:hypothetical protein FN846DRAFT_895558 [Sphaerosporella brunnea]